MMLLLDEQCRFPRATDQTFVAMLVQNHERNANFKKNRFSKDIFHVVHFAGEVEYTVHSFLDKNRETLSNLFVRAIKGSACAHYAGLVADVDDTGTASEWVGWGRGFRSFSRIFQMPTRTQTNTIRFEYPR